MDTDATADQRALLDVSSRFMDDACPLTAVRDGAWRDGARAAAYRRQAAELGWYSMLVPESVGGGSVSDNAVEDAALIAYQRGARLQPGGFVGTNVVADAVARAGNDEVRAKVLPALISGEASASWTGVGSAIRAGVSGAGGLELSAPHTPCSRSSRPRGCSSRARPRMGRRRRSSRPTRRV